MVNKLIWKRTQRNSNLELLRILAMLGIIAYHYTLYGNFKWATIPFSFEKVLALFFGSGGRLGVVIFVLISGYFGIKSTFNPKRLIALLSKTWLYSVLILLLMLFVLPNSNKIDTISIIKHLFPFAYRINWFITMYAIMYLFTPFMNPFINGMNQKQHRGMLLIMLVLWSIIPTLTILIPAAPGFSELGWVITLYFIGAYLRKYTPTGALQQHVLRICFWLIFLFVSEVCIDYLAESIPLLKNKTQYFSEFNTVPSVLLAVELVLASVKMKPFHNKFINGIASTTFGIYLIHDNNYMRRYLWVDTFKNATFWGTPLFWPHYIGVCLLVFIVCSVLDYLFWGQFVGKIVNHLIEKYFDRVKVFVMKQSDEDISHLEETI